MLSPEITLISTSFSLNHSIVGLTSGLIVSLMTTIPIIVLLLGSFSSSLICPLTWHKTTTRKPFFACSLTLSKIALSLVKYSGAPKAYQPLFMNSTHEYFLALEN